MDVLVRGGAGKWVASNARYDYRERYEKSEVEAWVCCCDRGVGDGMCHHRTALGGHERLQEPIDENTNPETVPCRPAPVILFHTHYVLLLAV